MLALGVGVAAIVIGAVFVLGVVVPAVFWLISLAFSIGLIVIGAQLAGRNRSPLVRVGGFAAIAFGVLGVLGRFNVFDLAASVFRLAIIVMMVAGAIYVGRRLIAARR